MAETKFFSPAEVAKHHTARSVWIIVDGKVYDMTKFLFDHPGGEEYILQYGGQDASKAMRDHTEHNHSEAAFEMLADYYIGELATDEKMDKPSATAQNGKDGMEYTNKEKFIDITKPMLYQVWTKNFKKDYYMQQVHIPRHCPGSAPIFGHPLLEMFTLTPWYVVPMVWLPVVAYHVYMASTYHSPTAIAIMFAIGILNWTFTEYGIHRFLFHVDDILPDNKYALTAHFLMHGIHHYLPMDGMRLVMPPVLFTALSLPVYNSYKVFLPIGVVHAVGAGTYFGYVLYDLMHYYLHHGRPYGAHIREMKTYHLDHHYKQPDAGFGITSKLWDYVFGTVLN
ncbi:hypothetical protein BJ742DRAFT_683992 [Cladochytrium replicatum]|nr:hypothetical protein BJ742DRAFT_683992 [Cladochytrium replicatum]